MTARTLRQALDVLRDLGLADLDLAGLEAGGQPALDLLDQLGLGLVQVDPAGIGENPLAAGAEQRHQRPAGVLGREIPQRDVECCERGRGDPAAAHVVQVMPAFVPQAPRRCGLADHIGRDVVVEHRLERPAAHPAGVAEAGAGEPGLGRHVGDHQLDMGHVLDRIAPGAARQRQPRELGLDRLDAHWPASPLCVLVGRQDVSRCRATQGERKDVTQSRRNGRRAAARGCGFSTRQAIMRLR